MELISHYHNNFLDAHFGMKKTCELLAQKCSWPTFYHDIEAYIQGCNICLASKTVWQKPYSDLQLLFVPMH